MTKVPDFIKDTYIICVECKGQGTLKIHNAYNLDAVETITCDYCEGEGAVDKGLVETFDDPDRWN